MRRSKEFRWERIVRQSVRNERHALSRQCALASARGSGVRLDTTYGRRPYPYLKDDVVREGLATE